MRVCCRFLPAYTMAPDAGKVKLLRCVVREDLSMGMVDNLVADIRRVVEQLDKLFVFTDKEVMVHLSRAFQRICFIQQGKYMHCAN